VRPTPYAQLAQFSRYLRAMKLRADRWKQQPAKDAERAKRFAPYARATARLERTDRRRWLVEELRVSVFAQELGTAESVSEVKLDRLLAGGAVPMDEEPSAAPVVARPAPAAPATPPPVQSEPARKATSLKSFGALGNLLRK
jgi:ATP-dependent helicase HrpA